MLDDLTFFQAHPVHEFGNALGAEQAHEAIFQAHKKLRRTWVALPPGPPAQLPVYPPRLVPFGADDGQPARPFRFGREFNIRAAPGHVGGNGDGAGLPGHGHNFGLALVVFGVQYLVLNFAQPQHPAQQFRVFNRGSTHQHRAAFAHQFHNFVYDSVVFFAHRAVHFIFFIFAADVAVGRNGHHVEFVNLPELRGFRFGGAGHAAEFVVHAEVVLKRDGGVGLGGIFHFHALFGFHGLMQPVAPPPPLHDAARLLVHNFYFSFLNNVLHIFLEQGVRFQQLVHGVNPLGLHRIVADEALFMQNFLLLAEPRVFVNGVEVNREVGQDEKAGIFARAGDEIDAFFGQIDAVVALIDGEIQRHIGLRHQLLVFGQVDGFGFLQRLPNARFAQKLDERFQFGQPPKGPEQGQAALFIVGVGGEFALGFDQKIVYQAALGFHHAAHARLQFGVVLLVATGHGATDNQRSTGIIDQY